MKILLLECESPSSLQFLKFYNRKKEVEIVCGASSRLPIVLFSRYKKKTYYYSKTYYPFILSQESIKKFTTKIEEIVRKEKIDYIVPQSESTLIPLLMHQNLKKYLLSPSLSVVNILHDKKIFFDTLNNFSIRSFKIPCIYEEENNIKFPIILKPRKGMGDKFVKIFKNKEEFSREIGRLKWVNKNFILQEYVPSKIKLTLNLFVSRNNEIKRILSFRRISMTRLKAVLSELEEFFKKIGYFGLASPQFLIYKNQLFLLEINPRLSYYYYGIDFNVGLYESFHENLIEDKDVNKKIKIIEFPPSLFEASKLYLKKTKDPLPILTTCLFTTLFFLKG
jgi:predicted ATP-grasp superfamily ATP-dependent carboligase